MTKEIFFLILAYILGSFPSGYIFTKIFSKKNILEIGWKKTSGSNVFKNVGILPGILTGFFDILKGFLAVFLAKKFGLSFFFQSLCALLSISGHNWSIFLKGAGGRGIGTFIGALLSFSPQITFFSLLFFLIFALLIDTSIATIFFLIFVIFLSFEQPFYLFPLISLFPIFLKRLSPLKELNFKNKKLILAKIIFDDITFHSPRIKKIFSFLTKRKKT